MAENSGISGIPEVKIMQLSDIKLAPYNPREITNEAIQGLQTSLEKFGYVNLLVVNKRNMTIIAGEQRYKILSAAGVKKALAILVNVDKVTEQAMNVTLNNPQIMGTWTKALIPLLEKLRNEIGDDYIELRLAALRKEVGDMGFEEIGNTLPDDIPLPPKEVITRPGDLWILGEHRLLCGNSCNEKDVAKLMDSNIAKLFATDPPYMVNYGGLNQYGNNKKKSKKQKQKKGYDFDAKIKDPEQFLKDFLSIGLEFIKQNSAIYMWHASSHEVLIRKVWEDLGILAHQPIIWVKPCAVMSFSIYPWRHEPCLLGWQQGHKPTYNPSNKQIGSVWIVDLMRNGDPLSPEYYTDIWQVDWEGKKRNIGIEHPTVKPTEVFAIPMRVHTQPGDICYEPFCGSGSQIIAAERLYRRCFAMEIEPIFCDVSVKRWEEFTGRKAKRITFN